MAKIMIISNEMVDEQRKQWRTVVLGLGVGLVPLDDCGFGEPGKT